MGILRGNQKGVSLVGLVVGSGVSILLATGFATFFVQQAKNMNRLTTKVELMDFQTTITKIMSDPDSCGCMFDMSDGANPYRDGTASSQIKVEPQGSGYKDIDFTSFIVIGKDLAAGTCDYTSTIEVARVGDIMPDLPIEAQVKSIKLVGLTQTAALDKDENPLTPPDAYEYKGDFEIQFENPDAKKSLEPLRSQVSFYTHPNMVAKSCDPSGEIRVLFAIRLAKFKAARVAHELAVTNQLIATEARIGTAVAVVDTTADGARTTATTTAVQQEAWATSKPGTGVENDDFDQIFSDFKARWGFP